MSVNTRANKIRVILGIMVLTIAIILCVINARTSKGIKITTWDNYYNENNIVFFYDDISNKSLANLNNTYKVSENANNEASEISKVLKTIDILNDIVEGDDVKETKFTSGYEILEKKGEGKKVSKRDMAIIERDLLYSIGYNARVGIFRKKEAQFTQNSEYYVVEYWSTQYNKWVMIDFLDKGYFLEGDNKLSAIEVLTKNIKEISYLGKSSQKDYKTKIKDYLASYSLQIDNTLSLSKSNCYVTYIKDNNAPELKFKDKFAPPTIFTKELRLFEKSPFDKQVGTDEKAYIILAQSLKKKDADTKKTSKDNNTVNLIIGGFKDDKIMNSYYLNINDAGYEKIEGYKDIELNYGVAKVELSLDGTNTISSIVIKNGK